jgi:glycine cleavage system H lipoate-binding protein
MKRDDQKNRNQHSKGVVGFNVVENECIWMKAGVVNFRLCDNAYDCNTCAFDMGMRKTLKSGNKKSDHTDGWAESLRSRYRDEPLPCRHALTGRAASTKICPYNYECYHCPYDQWLDDYDEREFTQAPSHRLASGYRLVENYYYHPGHTWARFEHGGRIRVGFDDFLAKLFGPLDRLELPPLGAMLKQNQIGWQFSREKHVASVQSPVSGTVLTVNYRTQEHPDIAHKDPYNEGWLFIIEPHMPKKNMKKLYSGSESVQWMDTESRKLLGLLGPEYERLAATGGGPVDDIYGSVQELEWNMLVETFLAGSNTR